MKKFLLKKQPKVRAFHSFEKNLSHRARTAHYGLEKGKIFTFLVQVRSSFRKKLYILYSAHRILTFACS